MDETTLTCPACGAALPDDAAVCPECGFALTDTPELQPEAPAEPQTLRSWARKNKKYLIAIGVGLAVGAATVGVVKERERIAGYADDLGKAARQGYGKAVREASKVAGKVADSKASRELKKSVSTLTGKAMAAVAVGKKVSESARDIKQFLDDSGLSERLPEAGKVLGAVVKAAGRAVANVDWKKFREMVVK